MATGSSASLAAAATASDGVNSQTATDSSSAASASALTALSASSASSAVVSDASTPTATATSNEPNSLSATSASAIETQPAGDEKTDVAAAELASPTNSSDHTANLSSKDAGTSATAQALSEYPQPTGSRADSGSDPGSGTSGSVSGPGSGVGSDGQGTRPIHDGNPNHLGLPVNVTNIVLAGATFAPVTMSVLFKSFWSVVFASAQMMEPFYQLAKGSPVTAKASVLRPNLKGGIDWSYLNPLNKQWVMFLTTVLSILFSVQASIASEAMTVQAGASCDTKKGRKLCDPVWVVDLAVVRSLQTTLVLSGILVAALIWLNWSRPSGLLSYPCSIASMAWLLGNSEDLANTLRSIEPKAKVHDVEAKLKHKLLMFNEVHSRDNEDVVSVVVRHNEQPDNDSSNGQESSRDLGSEVQAAASAGSAPSSWLARLPWGTAQILVVTILHVALFGVILSFVVSGNDIYAINLLGSDHSKHLTAVKWKFLDGTRFGPRFFMTVLISFLFNPFWEMVELKVRTMVPYRQLRDDQSAAVSRYLCTGHLHGVPFTVVFKALWHRNWYHAFIAFTTVLSYVLLILIAGVPYNYGQVKDVSFYSSLISVIILAIMMVAMVSLMFWHLGNPRMLRNPETLANTWLLMCSSRFVKDYKGRELGEVIEEIRNGRTQLWFGKAFDHEGRERFMIEAEESLRTQQGDGLLGGKTDQGRRDMYL